MSAVHEETPPGRDDGSDASGHTEVAGPPVTVRRNAGLAAAIGAAASAMAIAYLWRGTHSSALLDWVLCGLLAAIAAYHLAGFVDARTPLVVADDLGVRLRLGGEWRGLPWEAVRQVEVHPRRGPLRDGRLVVSARSVGRVLEGLDGRGKRQAALNRKAYGAALAVPLGLTTRVTGADADLVDAIGRLARERADVVLVEPTPKATTEPSAKATAKANAKATAKANAKATAKANAKATATARATAKATARATAKADAKARREPRQRPEPRLGPAAVPAQPMPEPVAETPTPVVPRQIARTEPPEDLLETGSASTPEIEPVEGATPTHEPLPEPEPEVAADSPALQPEPADDEADRTPPRPRRLGGIARIVSRVAKVRPSGAGDPGPAPVETPGVPAGVPGMPGEMPAAATAVPFRDARRALRAQITREGPATLGAALRAQPAETEDGGGESLPEGRELRRPGSVDLVFESLAEPPRTDPRVRPISTLGEPVEPIVIDEFVTEPAYDPVIGPELAASRNRVGLSVDELAERTRIRPHVIESIEVDDFAPCGGDVYARGHLRTLARVLGKDPVPLLATFEERYASAPVNARRVFEAELATGMTGSVRGSLGGPNWGLLVGAVIVLILAWGMVRLFATAPVDLQTPTPVLNGAADVERPQSKAATTPPAPLKVTLATTADSGVVVRDKAGRIVFAGTVLVGTPKTVSATPPVRVSADNAGAVTVSVGGHDRGTLGTLGVPGRRTLTRSG